MRSLHLLGWMSAGVMGLSLLGCNHDRHETVVVEDSRGPVYAEPGYVVVPEAPPRVIVEQRPVAPGPKYVWVDGYWHWNGHKYSWRKGHWSHRPSGKPYWVPPYYERHDRGYGYHPGYWSRQPPPPRPYRREYRDRD